MFSARANWTRSRRRAAASSIASSRRKAKRRWAATHSRAPRRSSNFTTTTSAPPYPLPKLDEIAVPGGFGGAMENWGGITYYESALLFDPANSSVETKQGIYQVIAHEIAHQWFGDLVTMAWWDNLWLNEGFASWMGSKCTAKFNPDWEVWLAARRPARSDPPRRYSEGSGDGRRRPLDHASDPASRSRPKRKRTAPSTISPTRKGSRSSACWRVFLGEEVFRDGIRKYIARHKFSNTTTADLWNALGRSLRQTGRRNRRQLDRATRLPDREGHARCERQDHAHARSVSR